MKKIDLAFLSPVKNMIEELGVKMELNLAIDEGAENNEVRKGVVKIF